MDKFSNVPVDGSKDDFQQDKVKSSYGWQNDRRKRAFKPGTPRRFDRAKFDTSRTSHTTLMELEAPLFVTHDWRPLARKSLKFIEMSRLARSPAKPVFCFLLCEILLSAFRILLSAFWLFYLDLFCVLLLEKNSNWGNESWSTHH